MIVLAIGITIKLAICRVELISNKFAINFLA